MAEPTENNLSNLYLPSVASTQPTEEEVAAENQRRRELDIEYGLTGGEYSSALANSQTGRPLSDKDLAFHLEMLSDDQSVAGTDQGTWTDYLQDIGNFIKNNPKALAFNYNQTNNQVRTDASLTGPKTKFSVGRSRDEGGPSRKKFSVERDVGGGLKVTAGREGGDNFANVQLTRDFKADGGELGTLNNKTYSIGPFGIDPEWLKSEFSYLEDIGDFVGDSAQKVADTDQEFMDEYYGESPEKSFNTGLGILSAFPAANLAKAVGLGLGAKATKPLMTSIMQTLGLGAGTLGSGIDMRTRKENEEADRVGYRRFSDHPDHPEFQKKANGGELADSNRIYNLLDSEYVTREGLNPDTPKLDAFAKALLPVNEDGTLNYGEAAMAMTPLGWVARLDKINDARRIANKQFKVGVALSSPSEQAAAKKVLDRLKRQEVDEFTPKQLSEYAAMQNKKVGTEVAAKEGIATLRGTLRGTLETAEEVAQKTAEQANIKGSAQGLDALFNALNK